MTDADEVASRPDARRGSLLGRIIATFVVVLTLSATLVAVFETGRNRRALQDQASALLDNELGIVRATVVDDLADQRGLLGGLARDLTTSDAVRRRDAEAVRRALRPTAEALLFDHVGLVTADGFDVGVGIGARLDVAWEAVAGGVTGLVLEDDEGAPMLVVSESVGPNAVLVGGTRIADAWAYRMRALVVGEVLVVVDGELVGTTLPNPPDEPLGWSTDAPPTRRASVQVAGKSVLVGYEQLAQPQRGRGAAAWLGVTAEDPLAALDSALLRDRLLALALLSTIGLLLALVLFRWVLRPVTELTAAAKGIAGGEFDHDFSRVRASGELQELARALDQMTGTLRDNTRTISRQAKELRRSTERLVQARDDERQRMASTLHDGFQQRLVVLRMRLRGIANDPRPEVVEELADDVLLLLTDLRRLSHDLYPSILRDRGLGAALHSLVSGTEGEVSVELEPDPLPRVPLETEANAYFLVSEGLTNALKHAPGAAVIITVRLYDEELEVCVIDEGPGFATPGARGAGLLGFEDRAAAVGGTCHITSDENGTWVVARLPVPADPGRPSTGRYEPDNVWQQLAELRRIINARKAAGLPLEGPDPTLPMFGRGRFGRGRSAPLEEQQDGGDAPVEVRRVR